MDIAPIFMHCNHTSPHSTHSVGAPRLRPLHPTTANTFPYVQALSAYSIHTGVSLSSVSLPLPAQFAFSCIFPLLFHLISSHLASPFIGFFFPLPRNRVRILSTPDLLPPSPSDLVINTDNKRRPFESLPPFGLHLFFRRPPPF